MGGVSGRTLLLGYVFIDVTSARQWLASNIAYGQKRVRCQNDGEELTWWPIDLLPEIVGIDGDPRGLRGAKLGEQFLLVHDDRGEVAGYILPLADDHLPSSLPSKPVIRPLESWGNWP